MKRSIIIGLMLASCGLIWAGGQQGKSGGGAQGTAAPKADGPVTISMWSYPAVTEAGAPDMATWKPAQVVKEKFNIIMDWTMVPSAAQDWDVKINAAGASNSLPDIMEIRREPWYNLIKAGLLAPVDGMYALMPVRTEHDYPPEAIAYTTLNGHSYGLASPGAIPRKEGMLMRKDWLDKLGLSVPVTTDDWMNVMKAFTFNDPDGNGKNDTYGYGAFVEINTYEEGLGRRLDPFFGAFGVAGTWNMTKANAGLNVRKPAYYDAMAFVRQMVEAGVIDPNWTSYKKDDFRAAWKQGRFGIMREDGSAFAAENNYAPFDKNFPNGSWIVVNPPKGPKGDMSVGTQIVVYNVLAISKKAMDAGKLPKIAELLEWMSSDEGYFLVGWGEKGINYNLDANGIPTPEGVPKPWTAPENVPITQLRRWVYYNSDVELYSRYPTYKTATSGKTMGALLTIREMQKCPWTNSAGADTLPTPNADLKRFYEQGVMEFITGQNGRKLTQDSWKAWVAEFDKMGGADWEKKAVDFASTQGYLQ